MLEKTTFKSLVIYVLIVTLFILAFFILKPVVSAIIYGVLLAYIFFPVYAYLEKKFKSKTIAALTVCFSLLIIIITAAILFLRSFFKQAINFYFFFREINIGDLLIKYLPNFFTSSAFPVDISGSINSFITDTITKIFTSLNTFILNIHFIVLNLFILFFVFYYSLKNGRELVEYIKTLSPLKKDTEEKFFKQFKDVTNSVLLGHIVVGIVQGIVAGIGFFIFGVNNALLLTFFAIIASVIPILGPWLVWVPVDIYLFSTGNSTAGFGLLIYGLFLVSLIDNFLRLIIITRKTQINTAIVLIGMIGGVFAFGFLGFFIGPLVLAYILLVLELYRKNSTVEDLIFKKPEE